MEGKELHDNQRVAEPSGDDLRNFENIFECMCVEPKMKPFEHDRRRDGDDEKIETRFDPGPVEAFVFLGEEVEEKEKGNVISCDSGNILINKDRNENS